MLRERLKPVTMLQSDAGTNLGDEDSRCSEEGAGVVLELAAALLRSRSKLKTGDTL
jgi:hypothetical protein